MAPRLKHSGVTGSERGRDEMPDDLERRVGLGGEDEVALDETVDLVRPDRELHLAPGEINVGVVPLLLGHLADAVGEVERLAKIFKLIFLFQMMLVDDVPAAAEL